MLHQLPPVAVPSLTKLDRPTLWVHPAAENDAPLSADVECLKWQAYLALRGLKLLLRTDVNVAGALDARLPNLHADQKTLHPAHLIPQWADDNGPPEPDYVDAAAHDESRAWIALMEGTVHAALLAASPAPSYLETIFSFQPPQSTTLNSLLVPPPTPLSGLASLCPPFGSRISYDVIYARYREAIGALSDRLGTDKWFLGSAEPTPLDALVFAYLHTIIMSTNNTLRFEVTRRVNLVAWEWRVRQEVRAAFV
ncbi:hypothetical protein H0H93_012270 [Arthromyces matolae]|nr:hypothetical protein H0H93_012270 [Arthromyces matolae]